MNKVDFVAAVAEKAGISKKDAGKVVDAFATVFAQVISVIVSLEVIWKKELPFEIKKTDIRIHGQTLKKMVGLGAPIASFGSG